MRCSVLLRAGCGLLGPVWCLALAWCLGLPVSSTAADAPPAAATTPAAPAAPPKWVAALEAIMGREEFRASHWGVLVCDLESGDILYEHQADKLFAPASTTKLFSCAAALEGLGADYRFATPVLARGELTDAGELRGDLILVASGDPTLGGRMGPDGRLLSPSPDHTYAGFDADATLTTADPCAGLNALAAEVYERGVRRVRGNVLIDDRLFDPAESTGSGPRWLTPIVINDNVLDLTITTAEPGQPARIDWRPKSTAIQVDARIDTAPAGTRTSVNWVWQGTTLVVRGQMPPRAKPLVAAVEFPQPAGMARALFIDALRRAGVVVDAAAAVAPTTPLPPRETLGTLKTVATFRSPPLSEHLRVILKVSHNQHASLLPLLLGAAQGERTLPAGLRVQRRVLLGLGLDVDAVSFGGGAGGDRADYVTPRATVQLLRLMAQHKAFEVYDQALPILGVDGTLADAVGPDSPARGHVRAKTGTLVYYNAFGDRHHLVSKALAGYCDARSGRSLAFALFVNQVPLRASEERARIGRVLGEMCETLHEGL